ncbi:uncharacterized protein EDB93DRAFT_1162723 [Suillus bovinus]|uniref:uncharacterized protein n=1 Tax=Suillus bovinus TaxID=48563 RepID=UPI001B8737E4|nr:uncharacterized protein EDB93DRAFT_1162723 [Suillus bovinus]KAG2139832.1 hypothetical protein EDB93DRAFT_1162723 [Suillus bovinus]
MDSSSADDVAAVWSLHYLACMCITLATIWTYDYISSLHDEWTFLLRSRCTKVKALYVIARYVPFFLVATDLCRTFTPNENPNTCRMLIDIYSCFGVISLACSEYIFVLRTYALWNKNRIVLVAMLSSLFAIIASFIGIWFTTVATSLVTTGTIPGTTGCYRNSPSVDFSMSFLLLFVFALGLFFLTVIKSWRTANGLLHAVLVKHDMFYYACGLFLSTVNVLAPVLFSYVSVNFLERLQVLILAILATRMHLDLWHSDWRAHASGAIISMSNV